MSGIPGPDLRNCTTFMGLRQRLRALVSEYFYILLSTFCVIDAQFLPPLMSPPFYVRSV